MEVTGKDLMGTLKNFFPFLLRSTLLWMLFITGCAVTQPTQFYVLSPLQSPDPLISSTTPVRNVAVGIGPVDLAPYLDRPQIVKRRTLYELDLAEFHKWAEPLKDNVARVLEENLSHLLSTDRVLIFPWTGSADPDYQIPVNLKRFDSTVDGETILEAQWEIRGTTKTGSLPLQRSRIRVPATGTAYPETVAAMSQAIGDLSRTIAASIVSLHTSEQRP